MTNELMSDNKQPEPEPGTATNIMTRQAMRKTTVKVMFVPKLAKFPPVRPRRWEFATVVMANDFISTIKPPPGAQLGSPKQWRAKIARLLRLTDISIVTNYEFNCELEVTGPEGAGDDTGMIEVVEGENLDTFIEGANEVVLDEPVDVEAILNEVDTNPAPADIEFPE